MSERHIEMMSIAGLQTSICQTGEGVPVLALHGWGGSIQSFWPVAERLAPQGFQIHLIDLPGFGRSELPPQAWTVCDYMQFVTAYLDARHLDRVAVLGHSFGGRISLVLGAEQPDRVSKMVLAASAGLRTPPGLKQRVRNAATGTARNLLDTLGLVALRVRLQDRYNRHFASEDYRTAGALRETFLRIIAEDLTPFAARIKAPTLLIWGDRDPDTPLWQGKKLEQIIPDAGLIVFEGAGHFAYLERLHDYLRIVTHFLTGEG